MAAGESHPLLASERQSNDTIVGRLNQRNGVVELDVGCCSRVCVECFAVCL